MTLRQREQELVRELRSVRKRIRAENRVQRGLGPKRQVRGSRDRDGALKAARGYSDPSSFVRRDGSEVLKGADWLKRRLELIDRSCGRCEREKILGRPHAAVCSGYGRDPHHIRRRSKGRDDRLSNLAYLSGWCHDAEDERKPRWSKR